MPRGRVERITKARASGRSPHRRLAALLLALAAAGPAAPDARSRLPGEETTPAAR
jgi:hypothetical protein